MTNKKSYITFSFINGLVIKYGFDSATLKVGDVRNHSIETVLNSTAAQKLRGSMYSLEALHPTCQKCQARPVEKVLKQ